MTIERLYLTRDCWWMNPSGTTYISDEVGNLSTYSHGVYKSINGYLGSDDATYLKFNGSHTWPSVGDPPVTPVGGYTDTYTSRLKSTNIVPTKVYVGVRASADTDTTATVLINGITIGSIYGAGGLGFSTIESCSGIFTLTDTQKERIFNGRIEDNYDYFQTYFSSTLSENINGKLYDVEVYYSGEASWNNYETGLPNIATSYHYPSNLDFRGGSIWHDAGGNLVDSSGYYHINEDPDGAGVDTDYIVYTNTPSYVSSWNTSDLMPSGGLSLYFNVTGSGNPEPLQSVTRAILNLRMSLPPSGLYENARDTFEVNGYNKYGKESDWFDDIPELSPSRSSRSRRYGYFAYGAGDIVEQSGFKTYSVELNFLYPDDWDSKYGDVASVYHRNVDILQNMEFQLVGLPSGVQLSAAELMLERRINESMTLYTAGDVYKSVASVYPDYSGYQNISLGNGMWHHRGNIAEAEIFDCFYKFNETSGVYTYPITNNVAFSGSYGTYLDYYTYNTKEPTRRNYYRNPIVSDSHTTSPTAYRDMIRISASDSILRFNSNAVNLSSNNDFTLYFMVYNDIAVDLGNWNPFFSVKKNSNPVGDNYNIYSYLIGNNEVRFIIWDQYNNQYFLNCEYEFTDEPLLIWLQSKYNSSLNTTTYDLYVHSNIQNYFSKNWAHDTITHVGKRSLGTYQTNINGSGYYLGEFGFANSYIPLEYNLTSSTVQDNYNILTSGDKRFFSSRASISPYLYNPGSGINWYVPDGSGSAQWNTRFFIDDWVDDATYYELIAPATTAYTNYQSHPSGIYVEVTASHVTNHPSGAVVTVDIEMDSAGYDNWKVWETEISIPSGSNYTKYTGTLKRHIGMDCGPIRYSDISSITLNLDTLYHNINQSYFGDLTIDSVKVYFDSSCVAATGTSMLSLYTYGGYVTSNNNLDLFVKNYGESNSNVDLYTISIASSGLEMPLYVSGGPPTANTTMNLYIDGLTPNYASGNFPLYTYATAAGVGGSYKSMPLFIEAFDQANALPLYIKTVEYGTLNTYMNLFLYNDNTINNNVNLFILGPSGYNESIPLYIRGYGTTDGAYPSNSNMNLFIARDSEAICETMPLYMAQKDVTHNFDMFIKGHIPVTSSIPLYIYGSGIITNNVKLYTHGY